MLGLFGSGDRLALLRGTVKAVAAIAFLSYCAADWLSSGALDRGGLAHLAAGGSASRAVDDPATTGALAQAIGRAKLDPCTGPRRP